LKNNLQRVDQISCREGLESIVSGSGTQGERGDQSYINFKAMHNKHSKVGQLGKISGIGGVGDAHRESIRQNTIKKVEKANERLKSLKKAQTS